MTNTKLLPALRAIKRAVAAVANDSADVSAVYKATDRAYKAMKFESWTADDDAALTEARSGLDAAMLSGRAIRDAARTEQIKAIRDEQRSIDAKHAWMRQ